MVIREAAAARLSSSSPIRSRPARAALAKSSARAAFFQAHIGRAAERTPPHLFRAPNPICQVPSLDAAWRHPHREPDAALIGDSIRSLRRPQGLDRTMRERYRSPASVPSHKPFATPLCSIRRNAVATSLLAFGGTRRTDLNGHGL